MTEESTRRPPDDWVPVDERLGGFDRRTIAPGVVALLLWFIWAHGVPFISDQLEYDNAIVAGDVVDLGEGELTFTPAVDWQLESGSRVSEEAEIPLGNTSLAGANVTLAKDGVSFEVAVRAFDGTPDELLDATLGTSVALSDLPLKDFGDRTPITTAGGIPGVLVPFDAAGQVGFVVALVTEVTPTGAVEDDGTTATVGIEVVVRASDKSPEPTAQEVVDMLASINYVDLPNEESNS